MLTRTLLLCAASAIAGVILVLSCSDDSPGEADAAVDAASACDCPAAEPPLAGRIVLEERPGNINSGNGYSAGATCEQVEGVYPQVLSGGCRIVDDTIRESGDMRLVESYKGQGPTAENWTCTYDNATTSVVQIMITLTCLQPARAE